MRGWRNEHFSPGLVGPLLATIGFVTWMSLSAVGGLQQGAEGAPFRLREAWDTTAYFVVGLPMMAFCVGLAGFAMPERFWKWPLWLVGGHQAGVLLAGLGMQSGVSLLILTMILSVLLATFFEIPALVGAIARSLATS